MTIDDYNILWLDTFEFLTYQKKIKLIELFGLGEDIRLTFESKKFQVSTILNRNEFNKMLSHVSSDNFNARIDKYNKQNIICLTLYSKGYPELLKNSVNPPLCLYCKGNIQLLDTTCCAIVGTRKPSDYGRIITKQFAKSLAENGVTIVSGLASGIDTISHETALSSTGTTIAVIAGGFEHIYPAFNHALFDKLIVNNLVVSEYPPETIPYSTFFPLRNRIIAGLSKAVLITEAGYKSGALHTKNYAIESGREVFAVPGRINSPESEGTNNIIRQCQSCLCTDVKQILEFLGIDNKKNQKNNAIQLDMSEQCVLNYILAEQKSYQEIIDYTKLSCKELNTVLFNLEMKGMVEKLMGNSYIAVVKMN